MKRIFFSDLHLEDPDSPVFRAFADMVRHEAKSVDEIYILGDLVEMWIGDDDTSEPAQQIVDILQEASTRAAVFVVHGNRDFLFGKRFCERTGARLLEDPFVLDGDILLSHGDLFCTDDHAYQEVRTLLRSEAWQQELMEKSLAERQQLGKHMRAQSMQANANKSTQIMDVNAAAIAEAMRTSGATTLIHGHTHRPGDYPKRGEDAFRRIVLGDWQDCGWLCRQVGDDLSLECFRLTRY
ncbi:MAG: UDP-2,3-diacylglucosamine diphosphatase, partial [Proteobacteria bacterium]|nr:UDP-2,3-diacylglucosamine diphosphatase [Pseudomonadota bacterium]